jgi:hypothetical protein
MSFFLSLSLSLSFFLSFFLSCFLSFFLSFFYLSFLFSHRPVALAIDTKGTTLFVSAFSAIRKVDIPTGDVTTLCGGDNCDSLDGIGRSARFDHPEGMYCDGKGRVFVCDSGNHTIRVIEPTTPEGKKVRSQSNFFTLSLSLSLSYCLSL